MTVVRLRDRAQPGAAAGFASALCRRAAPEPEALASFWLLFFEFGMESGFNFSYNPPFSKWPFFASECE